MNPLIIIIPFALGVFYGRMAGRPTIWLLAAAGLLMAGLLGNYPYYDVPQIAVTFASAIAGTIAGSWRNG